MFRLPLLVFTLFLFSCSRDNKGNSESAPDSIGTNVTESVNSEYRLTTRFNYFDTTVEIVFTNTKESISEAQKNNLDGFLAKQDVLAPEILKKIFDHYKSSYAPYREGWTMQGGISNKELEKILPTPTTPENLKSYIRPAIVYIQSKKDCVYGTIGIEFDCTWDEENGLGILIENWEVKQAGVAETAYFPH